MGNADTESGSPVSLDDWLFWHHQICTCQKERLLEPEQQCWERGEGRGIVALEWTGIYPPSRPSLLLPVFLVIHLNNKWNLDMNLDVPELQIHELPLENPEPLRGKVKQGQDFPSGLCDIWVCTLRWLEKALECHEWGHGRRSQAHGSQVPALRPRCDPGQVNRPPEASVNT